MNLTHSPSRALGGMVASAHPLASAAGAEIMKNGGNAFDAVVATVATLNVVEPFMSSLAGLGVATCWINAEQRVRCLDFTPNVPFDFKSNVLSKQDTMTGPSASGIPGNLAGWSELLNKYGKRNLSDVLSPAIKHARDGFPVSALYAHMAQTTASRACTPEWGKIFTDASGEISEGWVLKQPELAKTYEGIASEGSSFLYGGLLGDKIIDHLKELGGCMSMKDLQSVKPEWQEPISAAYRGLVINVPPPPAEAFQFLLTMRILEGFELHKFEHLSTELLDMVFRAIRVAAGVRISNNNKSVEEILELLTDRNIQPLQQRVADKQIIEGLTEQFGEQITRQTAENKSHTTSISIADQDGNMICLTQSLGSPWGSTVVIPGTGVCMNNFMYWGDLNPDSPNHLVGGQRWAMCLSPSISLQNNQPVLALGTPGSYGIMQTQAQALVHYVDYGLNLRQAIEAPRARLFDGKEVVLENRVTTAVVEELKRRGHDIKNPGPYTMQCGGMQAVSRDPLSGSLAGTADPRRDGVAIGV